MGYKILSHFKILVSKFRNTKIFKRRNIWSIAIFISDDNIFNTFKNNKPIIVFRPKRLQTTANRIYAKADPFLFVFEEELYLFFEEKLNNKAYLKAYKTKDLSLWIDCGKILETNFHLSFPFVFKYQNEIFLLPESSASQKLTLYKCKSFPNHWIPEKDLQGFYGKFVDSSILLNNNIYYLFTTKVQVNDYGISEYQLLLFFTKEITLDWIEHPKSPISTDKNNARCAGNIFSLKNKLYRPAQDCTSRYGGNFSIYEITTLSEIDYQEKTHVDNLVNFNFKWSKLGGHHFNSVEFMNKRIVATDGLKPDYFINVIVNLIYKVFIKLFNHTAQFKTKDQK